MNWNKHATLSRTDVGNLLAVVLDCCSSKTFDVDLPSSYVF